VQGIDEETALAIVATSSFDGQFRSISELQAAFNLGNQVLEPVFPDWPGYFADECFTFTSTPGSTTTTTPVVTQPAVTTPAVLPFTGISDYLPILAGGLLMFGALLLSFMGRNKEVS
jgi:hypothetical protein